MPGGNKSAEDSPERLGKTTAQECRKSTFGWRGSLKNVFAQAPYYLHEARVAGVWRRASAWRVFSRNFIFLFCSLETSATRVTVWRNIFSNVKWRWFPRLEVQSRINEVGYWNTLTFRHIKTWTVHSISVLSKQKEGTRPTTSKARATHVTRATCVLGSCLTPLKLLHFTFTLASSSRAIESGQTTRKRSVVNCLVKTNHF